MVADRRAGAAPALHCAARAASRAPEEPTAVEGRRDPRSVEGLCEIRRWADGDAPATVLFEVPHGATLDEHFENARARLSVPPAADLIEYFRLNTDFGAPEVAAAAARRAAERGVGAVVVRGLVPRTLVDLNRDLDDDGAIDGSGGVTPGLPAYVRDPDDRRRLREAWATYRDVAGAVYDEVVAGRDGLAVAVHTYAPRSVSIERFDEDVVALLRRAYAPGTVESWPLRPEADLILPLDGDEATVDERLVTALGETLAAVGVEAARSETYRLVPGTMARRRALAHPHATACLEIRRDLLGAPWRAFDRSRVDDDAASAIGAAIADACVARLRPR